MRIRKKFVRGTARVFISRKKAVKKLQLSLKDFRRLCILKGIYPREPNNVKKANKGSCKNTIFYHLKDINYLAKEPLLQKFREYKVFLRKVAHARAKKDGLKLELLLQSKPVFTYDHLVKERYPTFICALRDLDDALCLCFSFAALTQSRIARLKNINKCRRLVTEFMHYVIESNALRKAFISIKGVYYQAEIMGECITWVVGHERSVGRVNELDFSTMANFVDFYSCMLSFVNYRLYKSIGLFYPPQLQQQQPSTEYEYNFDRLQDIDDHIYSLAYPIKRTDKIEADSEHIDNFVEEIMDETLPENLRQTINLKTLFAKFKFFLNREVPKEPLAFVIRACNGFVCWEGCTPNSIDESSALITHQIVDRNIEKINFNRIYVQPQWVFDCLNARRVLPTVHYAPSAKLPPHVSPFSDDDLGELVPVKGIKQSTKAGENIINPALEMKKSSSNKNNKQEKVAMSVQKAKVYKESQQKKMNEEGHNLKLREMMIPKKHKRVYAKIKYGMKRKAKEANKLQEKRREIE